MAARKDDLVSTIAQRHPHLARSEVETVLTSVIDTINEALAGGGQIRLTETGSLSIGKPAASREATASAKGGRDIPAAIASTLDQINDRIESIL